MIFFSYLISGIIVCLNYGLIRSNFITRLSEQKWTIHQCAIGYFVSYTSLSINKAFMNGLFLYRIHLTFNNTSYEYNKIFLQLLYVMFLCSIVIAQCIAYYNISSIASIPWLLLITNDGYIYCSTDKGIPFNQVIALLLGAGLEFMFSAILLYLFISKVRRMKKTLLEQLVEEALETTHDRQIEMEETQIQPINNRMSSVMTYSKNDSEAEVDTPIPRSSVDVSSFGSVRRSLRRQRTISISEEDSLRRILKIHKLIKKQCILVCVALISSMAFWILSAVWNEFMSIMFAWDVMINSICIWLMFGFNDKYWSILTSYCVCKLCYINNYDE